MSHLTRCLCACAVLVLTVFGTAAAQGNPTGAVRGKVVDPDGLGLPGVTVTVASPSLQGQRTAVSSQNGDYLLALLPPGEYVVTYELAGFQTARRDRVVVAIAETAQIDVGMVLAGVTEVVQVTSTAGAPEIAVGTTVATTYKAANLELLPVGRTINAATLLAPGVTDNGPGGNIMISGAMSYENLFLINGVVVNENLRGQARNVFIEDAVQETKISTGAISAEFGRFQGGLVNVVTKSGSNDFAGTGRISFVNDAWSALSPFPGDANIDATVPTYEVTAGGPVFRDRLWYFGAGRFEKNEDNRTTDYTGFNYTRVDDEKRYELKGTYSPFTGHTLKAAYTRRQAEIANNNFGTIMDARSLYDSSNEENLYSANYAAALTGDWFVEGQYSRRELSFIGTGGSETDLANGTPIWDRSRGQARFNAPTFCKVCGSGVEIRNNWNTAVKATRFLSTERAGSHTFVAGADLYQETRQNDNYQSGSSYRVQATRSVIQGLDIFPVFLGDNTTYIEHLPLVAPSVGNDIRTLSGFANDVWRLNARLTLNLGVRFDRNRSSDQAGAPVVRDSAWSPRLGATWDLAGNGRWVANAGFARYVTGVNTAIVDAGSAGGRTATFSFFYQGPSINANASGPYLTGPQALPLIFDWFFANGGTSRAPRNAPSIPGVTVAVGDDLRAPNSNEWTAGLARQLGDRGSVRVDYVYRDYRDFYGDFRDPSTGKVTDPPGRVYDLTVVKNTDLANRTYRGVVTQASYRFNNTWQVGGNYTLSWQKGNFTGEDEGSGPGRFAGNDQPEYRQEAWNFPTGYNPGDQRSKLRGWVQYRVPAPAALGRIDLSVLERWDSSDASSADGTIDPRPYVTNPGYQAAPSTVTYFFGERGAQRYDDLWRTDLSLVWSRRTRGVEFFFRGILNNVFNQAAQLAGNETILTRTNDASFAFFNPFTETPVRGTHYQFGPLYGQPTGVGDYQAPREFNFSVGVRF